MEEKHKKDPYNILIVDDDAFLLDMYSLKFNESNFNVEVAPGTEPALEMLSSGSAPDIILLDLVMPKMDGFEFLEKITTEGLVGDALVIILSNLGQQSDIDRGLKLGARGFIIKASATPSEVVAKVLETAEKNIKK